MPETPPMVDDDLRADLAAYFALTSATELPASVARMGSATLRARRRSWWPGAAKPALALLGAAAVVVGGIA
ncbi:MAG: hypothetical protein M3R48_04530, partial [Candidatus Dormibacteraeota bacterium]|nr:hypothetical protein [Candidatus Dormibacteraeota bacterium]